MGNCTNCGKIFILQKKIFRIMAGAQDHKLYQAWVKSWFYNSIFSWQLSMISLSTGFRWMITVWAMRILHCVVLSEAQFETWWWPSARAGTCCLSNKYSTTLLVVFWLYYPVPSYLEILPVQCQYILSSPNFIINNQKKFSNKLNSTQF